MNSAKGALNFVGIGDEVSYSFQTHGDTAPGGAGAMGFRLVEGRQHTTNLKGIDPGARVTTHISVSSTRGLGDSNSISIGADWFGGGPGSSHPSSLGYPGATHKIHFASASSDSVVDVMHAIPGKMTANGGALFLINNDAQNIMSPGTRPNYEVASGKTSLLAVQSGQESFPSSGTVLSPSVWFGTGGEADAHITDATYAVVGAVMADSPADTLLIGAQEKDMVIRGTATGNILLGSGGGSSASAADASLNEFYGNRHVNRSGWNLKVDGANSLVTVNNAISMPEQAAVTTPGAGHGKIWVKSTNPTELWFTNSSDQDSLLQTSPVVHPDPALSGTERATASVKSGFARPTDEAKQEGSGLIKLGYTGIFFDTVDVYPNKNFDLKFNGSASAGLYDGIGDRHRNYPAYFSKIWTVQCTGTGNSIPYASFPAGWVDGTASEIGKVVRVRGTPSGAGAETGCHVSVMVIGYLESAFQTSTVTTPPLAT
jgi:hypothetical protein